MPGTLAESVPGCQGSSRPRAIADSPSLTLAGHSIMVGLRGRCRVAPAAAAGDARPNGQADTIKADRPAAGNRRAILASGWRPRYFRLATATVATVRLPVKAVVRLGRELPSHPPGVPSGIRPTPMPEAQT